MPFIIKVTYAFAGLEQGWSETWYYAAPTGDLDQAETFVTPLAQKRAKLLANGYTLNIVRTAVVVDDGGQKVKRITDLFEPRLAGVAAWAPSSPNLALMCVWQTGNNRLSKKQYMRGIPAGIGDSGKAPDFGFGTFASNFNAWRSAMVAAQAGWLATTVDKTAVISAYQVNPDTAQVTFTLSPGFTSWPVSFGVQTPVNVSLPGKSPLDGRLMVIPTSLTSCFTPNGHPAPPLQVGQIGLMTQRVASLVGLAPIGGQGPVGVIHPQRIVTHKTGRPSYASRGRVAAKPRW